MPDLLNDEIKNQVRQVFEQLHEPVEVLFFGQKENCQHCDDALQLVQEVSGLSDLLNLQIYDLDQDAEVASQYNVDKAPGLVIAGREGDQIEDYGIRFAGIPAGHEFSSLVHDLVLVSSRDSGLDEQTRELLHSLEHPVLLQVFVTPT
jgi:glutaredoxin-like protein